MKVIYSPYVGKNEQYEMDTLEQLYGLIQEKFSGVFEHIRIDAEEADDGTKVLILDDVNWKPSTYR